MKSKPPNKKVKVEASTEVSTNAGNNNNNSRKASLNSTSTDTLIATVKASMVATASEVFASSKQGGTPGAGRDILVVPSDQGVPSYPNFHLISDLGSAKDFPQVAHCLEKRSSGGEEGKMMLIEDVDLLQRELETLWSDISLRLRSLRKEQLAIFGASSSALSAVISTDKVNLADNLSASSTPPPLTPKSSTISSSSSSLASPKGASGPARLLSSSNNNNNSNSSANRKTSNSTSNAGLKLEKTPKKKSDGDVKVKPRSSGKSCRDTTAPLSSRHAPNLFWDFAHSYCRQITDEDLDAVQKVLDDHEGLPQQVFQVPSLGPHFKNTSPVSSARAIIRDRIETRSQDVCGPLTQRLVAALVDSRIGSYRREHCMSPSTESTADDAAGHFFNRPDLLSALGLDGSAAVGSQPLEIRLRQVLLEQGLLMGDEAEGGGAGASSEDPRDEILTDIKRTQSHLLQLHEHNSERLKYLCSLAKKELLRIEAKRELEKADKELLEAYRLISSARTKKKPLSKREREVATRALENRRTALDKLIRSPPLLQGPHMDDNPRSQQSGGDSSRHHHHHHHHPSQRGEAFTQPPAGVSLSDDDP